MMMLLVFLTFAGGLSVACYALMSTIAPNVDKILTALSGQSGSTFTPLASLVRAERRIAVRRWATVAPSSQQARAAA